MYSVICVYFVTTFISASSQDVIELQCKAKYFCLFVCVRLRSLQWF